MKKLSLILIATIAFSLLLSAQESLPNGSISGKIIDEVTNESMQDANIRILTQKDSVFVIGKASNKDGSFSIPLKNGSYIIQVSYIGYVDAFKDQQ